MRSILMSLLLIAGTIPVFAQTGQCPPGGCVGGTAPPPVCTVKICGPTSPPGIAGKCETHVINCPEVTPPVPACVNSWGQVVACPK
jgi:hypothetical protein